MNDQWSSLMPAIYMFLAMGCGIAAVASLAYAIQRMRADSFTEHCDDAIEIQGAQR